MTPIIQHCFCFRKSDKNDNDKFRILETSTCPTKPTARSYRVQFLNQLNRHLLIFTFSADAFRTTSTTTTTTTMKLAVLASIVTGAAAFAPSQTKQATSTSALQAFENDFGASKWDGGYFDPLGLVADGDQAKFDRLRLTEVKHGRESFGWVGHVVVGIYRCCAHAVCIFGFCSLH